MKCLLFANGAVAEGRAVTDALASYDMAIAADGGYHAAVRFGIPLRAVVGDLDSVHSPPNCPTVPYPREKNETDLELAIEYALQQGASECVIIGALGKRTDHALANLYLLGKYQDLTISIVHGSEITFALPAGTHTLRGKVGETFSLFPLGGAVTNITTTGCKYPLTNATLPPNAIVGISNLFTQDTVSLSFESGTLLVTIDTTRA